MPSEKTSYVTAATSALLAAAMFLNSPAANAQTKIEPDPRLNWWREARFGMFIHFGAYSTLGGQWKDQKNTRRQVAEQIRDWAHIPEEEYQTAVKQFNPVKFDADQWVTIAKQAGMKYIVITTKHHDGFCLFDSKYTDYDVMSTPFKRDIMKELADACRRGGIKMCWYYSIMDWHHPDYTPVRPWETNRSTEGAQFDRYFGFLKNQLNELATNYGKIGVMWFDGEWEDTWDHQHGQEVYDYLRKLDPDLIINNRVDRGRIGPGKFTGFGSMMNGRTKEGGFAGDFETPEQGIPKASLGTDWETCMTMNHTWGYSKHDQDWKSTEDLIRKLVDIASKGGNFLMNVGPMGDGQFPPAIVERLEAIGAWMKVNGESIYGTSGSPFERPDWGRCTQKPLPGGKTRLYLHVFSWPEDKLLTVAGLENKPSAAYLLSDSARTPLRVTQQGGATVIAVPAAAPDPIDTVIVLDIEGQPRVGSPR